MHHQVVLGRRAGNVVGPYYRITGERTAARRALIWPADVAWLGIAVRADAENPAIVREEVEGHVHSRGNRKRSREHGIKRSQVPHARLLPVALSDDGGTRSVVLRHHVRKGASTLVHAGRVGAVYGAGGGIEVDDGEGLAEDGSIAW